MRQESEMHQSEPDRTHDVRPWELALYAAAIAATLLGSSLFPMGFAS